MQLSPSPSSGYSNWVRERDGERSENELAFILTRAAREQDVLYLVFYLKEMRNRGMLLRGRGILNTADSTGPSVLDTVASTSWTDLVQFTLSLLFFCLETYDASTKSYILPILGKGKEWALKLKDRWNEVRWKDCCRSALALLQMPNDAAVADWIDANLPISPFAHSFTGYVSLPPTLPLPAVDVEVDSASPKERFVASEKPETTTADVSTVFTSPPPPATKPLFLPIEPSSPPHPVDTTIRSPSPLPRRRLPPPPPPPLVPPPLFRPWLERLPWAKPTRRRRDGPITLHIYYIHRDSTKQSVRRALFEAGVCPGSSLELRGSEGFLKVSSTSEWEALDEAAPRLRVDGHPLNVEVSNPRRSEQGSAQHRTVVLEGWTNAFSTKDMEDCFRSTRCGLYDPLWSLTRRGSATARCISVDLAERAVKMLDGLHLGGEHYLRASWIDADGLEHRIVSSPRDETVKAEPAEEPLPSTSQSSVADIIPTHLSPPTASTSTFSTLTSAEHPPLLPSSVVDFLVPPPDLLEHLERHDSPPSLPDASLPRTAYPSPALSPPPPPKAAFPSRNDAASSSSSSSFSRPRLTTSSSYTPSHTAVDRSRSRSRYSPVTSSSRRDDDYDRGRERPSMGRKSYSSSYVESALSRSRRRRSPSPRRHDDRRDRYERERSPRRGEKRRGDGKARERGRDRDRERKR